ncbi:MULTISPECIES: hypothetical protein [Streptomyces]|uniref:Uncharacterized protein n=1 Tax=Streptomyces albogriseolus TaxID=1887 RepID=A0ACC6UST9_STRAO|nr:hypothetical protein GCM10010332_59340 [Streptomyces albogriseolus]GHG40561.1 hypothetical protein GCM10018777_67400 [Streptomyces viridodiastaticus]
MRLDRLGDEGEGIAESDTDTGSEGDTIMFEIELHRLRHDELIRRAETERRVREAVRVRRAARRGTAARGAEPESHTRRRSWFARTA